MIKTDFIKRQQELSKIIEEQQKIREEYNENIGNDKDEEDSLNKDNVDKKESDEINKDIDSKENKDGREPETGEAPEL